MSKRKAEIGIGVDWMVVWLYALLVVIGLLCIFSVEYRSTDSVVQSFVGFKKNYSKQFFYFLTCIVIATFILLTDSKLFTAFSNISYLIGIVLIILTFVIGKEIKGSKSWIPLGFMNLQPVEMCKIFTALALSKYLCIQDIDLKKTRSQLIAASISFLPAAFSILQGETGLALVYFSFLIPMYREGLSPVYLIAGIAMAALLIISLLFSTKSLLIAFSIIALVFFYLSRRQVRRNKGLLVMIVSIWAFC
jgi:rod shape determining protein RodA